LQFIKALTLLKDIAKLTSVSKMDEILEAAILGAVYDDDIEEAAFLTYFGQIALKLF
jgi:hypothetical protein